MAEVSRKPQWLQTLVFDIVASGIFLGQSTEFTVIGREDVIHPHTDAQDLRTRLKEELAASGLPAFASAQLLEGKMDRGAPGLQKDERTGDLLPRYFRGKEQSHENYAQMLTEKHNLILSLAVRCVCVCVQPFCPQDSEWTLPWVLRRS